MQATSSLRETLITGGKTVRDVSEDISRQVEGKPSGLWWTALSISLVLLMFGVYCLATVLWEGIGVWGLNKTVGWAWDITNFVWWVFGTDKGALLGKAGRGHFYAGWEQFAPLPRRWLRQACARLARQLRGEGEPWLEHPDDDADF